jgi:hypothetical protein
LTIWHPDPEAGIATGSLAARANQDQPDDASTGVDVRGGQLIHQLLQRHLLLCPAGGQRRLRRGKLTEQTRLAIGMGIEVQMAQWALDLLMLPMGNAHQPHPIVQLVLQGAPDAAEQIGLSGLACSAAGN